MIRRRSAIQHALGESHLDGWLLYDFHGQNPIALRVSGLPTDRILTRRWACFIPTRGEPRWLVHHIEQQSFRDVEGTVHTYVSWRQWRSGLAALLAGARRVAMEISPGGAIPTVSWVDAGTWELVRSLGVDVVSSADVVQVAEAVWTQEQLEQHIRAARHLLAIKDMAFAYVRESLRAGRPLTELDVQAFIVRLFRENDLVTDHPPIVAVDEHTADPHFAPHAEDNRHIRPGTWLLIDMWAKEPGGVYADITWMAYAGERVPSRAQRVFQVVRQARDAVLQTARERLQQGRVVRGWELDDIAREVIRQAGLADYFPHRTGHSLGQDVHGHGVNLDNLETHDYRELIPGIGFTVEPGVYMPEEGLGVRLEVDCYVRPGDLEVTTLPLQEEWVLL